MLSGFKFTLYEIFGYLFPGFFCLAGLAVIIWSCFFPRWAVQHLDVSLAGWVGTFAVAYVLGHAVQAIANLTIMRGGLAKQVLPGAAPPKGPSKWLAALIAGAWRCVCNVLRLKHGDRDVDKSKVPVALVTCARRRASELLGIRYEDLDFELLYQSSVSATGKLESAGDLEMYMYREGFCRGMSISLLVVGVALLIPALVPGASIQVGSSNEFISTGLLLVLAGLSFAAGALLFYRYQRFLTYKVTESLLGLLLLPQQKSPPEEDK